MATIVNVGPEPTRLTCPSCNTAVVSRVERSATTMTHLIALLLCGIGCCCIPYCVDSCQGATHYCPNCQAYLGAYKN